MDASAVKLLIAQLVGVVACGGACFLSWQVKKMWKLVNELASVMESAAIVLDGMDTRMDGLEASLAKLEKEVSREDS